MTWPRIVRGVRALLRPRAVEREMDEEMRFHLEMEIAQRIAAGLAPAEARRTAHRDFGGIDVHKEEARDGRALAWLAELRQDAVHALRLMRRFPGVTVAAVLVTALGVGSTTAIVSIVSGVLLRPLPFPESSRVAALYLRVPSADGAMLPSLESFEGLARATSVVQAFAAYAPSNAALTSTPEPEQLRVEEVTPSMFPLLRVAPALGRALLPAENGPGARVVVISHDLWRRQFGGDSAIIGRVVVLDEVSHTVVGVMPEGYAGARDRAPALWRPLDLERARARGLSVIVRLSPGVSERAAEAWLEASGILRPARAPTVTAAIDLVPLAELLTGTVRSPLLVLLGAVGFVLVLVGANIATLLLARASAREREMAVRRALGATRTRQVRQLLTESIVLTALGGAVGVLLAWWSISAMPSAAAGVLPRLDEITMDWRVLLFGLAIVLVSGALAGLAPALIASRGAPSDALKGASASGTGGLHAGARWGGIRAALVIAEVALSVSLLVGAGLLVKSFLTIFPRDPGFDPSGRLAMAIRLDRRPAYEAGGPSRRLEFVEAVTRRLAMEAGVRDVAATSFLPFVMMSSLSEVDPLGRSDATGASLVQAHHRAVTANYFAVMEIPVVRGRAFTTADVAGAERVVIVNETAARRWWPGEEPLGRDVTFSEGGERSTGVVVGVVGDVRFSGFSTRANAELFVPYAQRPWAMMTFIVRTAGDPAAMMPAVRRALRAVDPALPIDGLEPLADIVEDSVAIPRFYAAVMAAFAAIALVLALAGIFSVLAYTVSSRQRELGIRLALGAPPARVLLLVVRQGMAIALVGIALGALLARWVSRVLEALLLEVSATDPGVFAGMLSLLVIAALAACLIPARRAARVDPLTAIRGE